MRKTIVVAGGAGFIPSHVCQRLVEEGNDVICVDNLITGSKNNIESYVQQKKLVFIQKDITDNDVATVLPEKIDEIYHLASPASVTYIMEHPVASATVNSVGTKNLLDVARKRGAKLLFASSSEAYGDPKEHPQKESYWGNVNSVGMRSGYDEGKRFGEALCMAYSRELGVDVKIIRIFNTYGPNSSPQDSRVIPAFVTAALQNKPIPVHGDGSQTRSFCYVTDMADGMVRMMESNQTGPINLGNPDEFRVVDVAKKIIELTRSTSQIANVARPPDDPSVRKPDITKAKELLGWEPKVSLDEGLPLTIAYFRGILAGNE